MPNTWGSDLFERQHSGSLESVVKEFPANLKQAMLAAASTRPIKRGTWNGCAFNEAGKEVEGVQDQVASTFTAAQVFGVSQDLVSRFIHIWDSMGGTDVECTDRLKTAIEKADLFLEPGERKPRIVARKVYEDQRVIMRQQFEALMAANAVPDTDAAFDLLVGASA